MTSFKKPIMAKVFCPFRLICLILFLCFADATIEIFDPYGKKVDSFMDREAFDDDFFTLEGYLSAAEPSDACTAVEPPTYLTNFTMSKFLLVNGSDACIFTTKVSNAEKAGYDVVIMYDSTPTPYQYVRYAPIPRIAFDIQLVFVSFFDGMIMKNNYLFNSSFPHNYRIKLKPNTPDITYYMYLFGAVIGVCFFVMLLFMTCLLIKCIQERRRLRRNRLSSRQIKQIPTAKFAKGDQYDVCAICLENYNEGDKLRILPCSHAYHTKCIDPWLMNNRRNCPLCKRKIRFGDSGDESDSEDSELTSPTENTPLLRANGSSDAAVSPLYYSSLNPRHNVEANRLSHVYQSGASSENPFASEDDSESLLPPARSSVNGRSTADVSTSGPPDLRWCHLIPRHGMESIWPREASSENPANGRSAAAASTSGDPELCWSHLIPRDNVEARLKRDADALSENPFISEDDCESLLPPARSSANGRSAAAAASTSDDQRVVVVNFGATQDPEVETDQRGLIV